MLPEGVAQAGRVRDAALVLLAADAFGSGSRLVDMSVEYAKTREQFGVTIEHFQAVKHQLANMAVELEPSRGLFWYAAHAFDHIEHESERAAALAKAHISDRVMQIARDSVEAHGGIGFTWECDVHLFFKRSLHNQTLYGDGAYQRRKLADTLIGPYLRWKNFLLSRQITDAATARPDFAKTTLAFARQAQPLLEYGWTL